MKKQTNLFLSITCISFVYLSIFILSGNPNWIQECIETKIGRAVLGLIVLTTSIICVTVCIIFYGLTKK